MNGTYVAVSELPKCLQTALSRLGFRKADVSIVPAAEVSPIDYGSSGRRAFFCPVNMSTGEIGEAKWGSWGGANAFNPDNAVDMDKTRYPLPVNGACIKGSEGGTCPIMATIYVNPSNIAALLPASSSVTDDESKVLYTMRAYKSGYRKAEFERLGLNFEAMKPALLAKGLISVNAAGSATITTAGKNAAKKVL